MATDRPELGNAERAMTRRRLVAMGAASAAAIAAPTAGSSALAARRRERRSPLRRSSYYGLKTRTFRVGPRRQPVKLVAVEDLPVADTVPSLRGSDDAFLLRFVGKRRRNVGTSARTMRHPQFGRFRFFISPIERPGSRQHYAAIVNRVSE